MEQLAVIIPEKIPKTISKGVQRAFLGLHMLPDEYLIYYEPLIDPERPDFIIISPDLGLLVIEIRDWYPAYIASVTKDVVRIAGSSPGTEISPLTHAVQYLADLEKKAEKNPIYAILLQDSKTAKKTFCFPTGYLLLFPNCTIAQLSGHQLGDLHRTFDPNHTICREMLIEMERWDREELIPFLRSFVRPFSINSSLTDSQIRILRALVHPEVAINLPNISIDTKSAGLTAEKLQILDYAQEKKLYQIHQGHQIVYGVAGSGKTTILIARARILHNYRKEAHLLVLCSNNVLGERLRGSFTGFPRIHVYAFEEWAERHGIVRIIRSDGEENDQELGLRLIQQLKHRNGDYQAYDSVLIDQGQDFSPAWYQSALLALRDPEKGDLLIVSDGLQGRSGPGGISWSDCGIHHQGRIIQYTHDLENNYRSTREILKLSRLFLNSLENEQPGNENIQGGVTGKEERAGLKPLLVWNTTHANQGEYATYLVKRLLGSLKSAHYLSGLSPDDIAILYPYADEHDKRIIIKMAAEIGKFCPVQWVAEDKNAFARIHLPGVKVHDIHSVKGMQYRAVMIIFSEYYDRFFRQKDLAQYRHLWYVALTRPQDFITIQYTEKTELIRTMINSGDVDQFIGK